MNSPATKNGRLPWLENHRLDYPEALPISLRIADISAALMAHQVIVVAGATGSGKTTQLPKIALQLGRGTKGRIGHTQPRRVAARSVAARLAEELRVELGQGVGYQVRFNEQVGADSYIKLMTDGILLAELKRDRLLKQYDTLIIDEAHERSLNIDFLLGYLKRLLPKRPDLKIIITSATLDHQRFAAHFNGAPIIEVSGRTHPVEIRYRPIEWRVDEEDSDLNQAILTSVNELWRDDPRGDILVFLSGERAIRDCLLFLKKQALAKTELLPLFGRLSSKEQQAIFFPQGMRRIILATNIAETSLTVPGIKYVIDSGLARLKRYSYRTKIQRLPIEAIAQANAAQRAGRCGRTSPGICIRLYSADDFALRPLYTEPEILRSNLAAVILQMTDLGLGGMTQFPFLDPPDGRFIRDGEKCLEELAAITEAKQLTRIGQQLLAFPIDPRLGRILVEAEARKVLPYAVVIVAALSVQDVRDRPFDKAQAADQAHQPFRDERSDFVSIVKVWQHLQTQQQQLSSKQFREYCRSHYFSYMRFKDWQDLVSQLTAVCHEQWPRQLQWSPLLAWDDKDDAMYGALHKTLLSGYVNHVLQKIDKKEYLGTRNRKLNLFPGSAVFKKAPNWLVCAEMVETAKLYARHVASIEPEWVAEIASHLVKKTYSDPQFDSKRGEVFAFEKVLLFGLPLIHQRRVAYAAIQPEQAHRVFIREALALQRYESRLNFYMHNQALFATVHDVEQRTRDSIDSIPIDALMEFFERTVPVSIADVRSFETWYKRESVIDPSLLCLDDAWLQTILARQSLDQYPSELSFEELKLPITYQFAPGSAEDGVSLQVPALLWRQLPKGRLAWLVPGLLDAKIAALFKNLPKAYRRALPSNMAQTWHWRDHFAFASGELFSMLASAIAENFALTIPLSAWQESAAALPEHLRFHIKLVHDKTQVGSGRDFDQLEEILCKHFSPEQTAVATAPVLTTWTAALRLPKQTLAEQGTVKIPVYLAWQQAKDGVVQVELDNESQAMRVHQSGVLQWLLLALKDRLHSIFKQLFKPMVLALVSKNTTIGLMKLKTQTTKLAFFAKYATYVGDETAAWHDFCEALLTENFAEDWWQIRDQASFDAMKARHEADLYENATILLKDWQRLAERLIVVKQSLLQCERDYPQREAGYILTDIEEQLQALIYPGFFAATPYPWRERLSVYLQGMQQRLVKCFEQIDAQILNQRDVQHLWRQYQLRLPSGNHDALLEYRFMLEEYRLSLFAQTLKTVKPVSRKRLNDYYEKL